MFRLLLLAVALAQLATSQTTVTFTARSGSVGTAGGPQHTIPGGTNMAPGLNLTSSAVSGPSSASCSLQIQPMVVAAGGVEISVESNAQTTGGLINTSAQFSGLVTLQSPTTSSMTLDFTGSSVSVQAGGGLVTLDIDDDGVVEFPRIRSMHRVPIVVGPTPRTVSFTTFASAFFDLSRGIANLNLRIVPGTCNATQAAASCPNIGLRLWYRESVFGGVDIFFPPTSTNPHLIVVIGAQLLATPFPLPQNGCPLHVDPITYWFVPRHPTLGATVHLDVPASVLPIVGYLTAIDYHPTTLTITTPETLRIDCQ